MSYSTASAVRLFREDESLSAHVTVQKQLIRGEDIREQQYEQNSESLAERQPCRLNLKPLLEANCRIIQLQFSTFINPAPPAMNSEYFFAVSDFNEENKM